MFNFLPLQFGYFDDDSFKDLRRLTTLRLDGNQLIAISVDLLPVQKSLERLGEFSFRPTHRIERWTHKKKYFSFISIFKWNEHNFLRPHLCVGCILFGCRYVCVCMYVFSIRLDLARNRLTEIANGAFEMLLNLTHLDVSYNKLAKLETANMEPLEKLQSLNISGNTRMDLHEMRPTLQVSVNFISEYGVVFSFVCCFFLSHIDVVHISFVQFPLLRWHALCVCMWFDAIAIAHWISLVKSSCRAAVSIDWISAAKKKSGLHSKSFWYISKTYSIQN